MGKGWWRDSTYFRAWKRELDEKLRYCVNDQSGIQRDWVNLGWKWISGNFWAWFVRKTCVKGGFQVPLGGCPRRRLWTEYALSQESYSLLRITLISGVKIIAWLREKSIWHPAWLGKLGVNMNFKQFLGVICPKNLRESVISSPLWRAPITSITTPC